MWLAVAGLLLFMGSGMALARHGRGGYTEYVRYNGQSVRIDIYDPGRMNSPVVILIHGAAGIEGDRAERFRSFATDLRDQGMLAVNVHYFNSPRPLWTRTIQETISHAGRLPNADPNRLALVGYSLGGTVALSAAAADERVARLVIESGYLPRGFNKEHAARLPPTYISAGTEDTAINTLYSLKEWLTASGIPIETRINEGHGHSIPMWLFQENWRSIVDYLGRSLQGRY